MSAEVVKKRGRPKKVVADQVEVEIPEKTKSTSRAKSTKAAPAAASKAKATTTTKASTAEATKKASTSSPITPKKAAKPPPPTPKLESQPPPSAAVKQAPKTSVTPETSKILGKVRDLAQKPSEQISNPTKSSQSTSNAPTTKTNAPSAIKGASPPPPKTAPTPTTKPKIPVTSLNSEIVSNITTRAGARPNATVKPLPSNYKPVARKIIMGIVAAPIAIVTSYVLYERLVLGKEQKILWPGTVSAESEPVAPVENVKSESS